MLKIWFFMVAAIFVWVFIIAPSDPCADLTKDDAQSAGRNLVRLKIRSSSTANFLRDGEGAWIHGCTARVVGKFDSVPNARDWSTYYLDLRYEPRTKLWDIENAEINERP